MMSEITITCHFGFETFHALLEIGGDFSGMITEIYDCEVCCNPNKLSIVVSDGSISSIQADSGNE